MVKPEFIMKQAGPWRAVLLVMEWMKAMSSTQVASLGKRSLIHLPHSPCCRNFQKLPWQLPGLEAKNSSSPVVSKGLPERASKTGL